MTTVHLTSDNADTPKFEYTLPNASLTYKTRDDAREQLLKLMTQAGDELDASQESFSSFDENRYATQAEARRSYSLRASGLVRAVAKMSALQEVWELVFEPAEG